MRRLLVALVVVAALAVAGDRVAAVLAAQQVERELAARGMSDPHVAVAGVPFLSQAADRRFRRVILRGDAYDLGPVSAREVRATLTGVRVPRLGSSTGGRAARLDGSALVTFDELESSLGSGVALSAGPQRSLAVRATVDVAGQQVTVAGYGPVAVRDGVLVARPEQLDVEGAGLATGLAALPADLQAAVRDRLALRYPLPRLPAGLEVRDLRVEDAGLRVTVRGTDVALP